MIARKSSLLRHFLWAFTLATGLGTVWFVVILWCAATLQDAWPGGKHNQPNWEDLVVRADGTPLVRSRPVANPALMTFRDSGGRAQPAPDRDDLLPAIHLSGIPAKSGFFSRSLDWVDRLRSFVNERDPHAIWYFVYDGKPDGSGYFVGYERISNRRLGLIGQSGFRSGPLPDGEQFPVRDDLIGSYSYWSSVPVWLNSAHVGVDAINPVDLPPRLVYVPTASRLQRVDLADRSVTTIFETVEPIDSIGIPVVSTWAGGRAAKEQPILVRTKDRIHALDHNNKVTRVVTIPTEIARTTAAQWYELKSGEALLVFTPASVYRIAADGTIREHFDVALQHGTTGPGEPNRADGLAFAMPEPSLLLVADLILAGVLQESSDPAAFQSRLARSAPSWIAVFALSCALAVMAWRRSRAYGRSKQEQSMWAVFVLLFGPAAYGGMLLYRRWPIWQPCPHCHEPAPRDRPECVMCQAPFPEPALRGTEIFA